MSSNTPDRPAIRNQPPPAPPPASRRGRKNTLPPDKPPLAFEYKLVPYIQQNIEDLFNSLGALGWEYRGNETGTGKAVFIRKAR